MCRRRRQPHVANADIIIAGGKIRPGQIPQGSVAAAGVVQERLITVGRIEEAGVVVTERFITVGRVAVAAGVRRERAQPVAVFSLPMVLLEERDR